MSLKSIYRKFYKSVDSFLSSGEVLGQQRISTLNNQSSVVVKAIKRPDGEQVMVFMFGQGDLASQLWISERGIEQLSLFLGKHTQPKDAHDHGQAVVPPKG